jgi:hypothetical protein
VNPWSSVANRSNPETKSLTISSSILSEPCTINAIIAFGSLAESLPSRPEAEAADGDQRLKLLVEICLSCVPSIFLAKFL